LTEVELCEGLVEIGVTSFNNCGHSITMIIIPNSLRRILYCAFYGSLRCPIRLHDGIELTAYSPTLESRPSSPWIPHACYAIVDPHFPSKCH
jgi:hypothetical protein